MEEFFSRNHFYIDPFLQTRIENAKIAFLGTGLASTIAEVMVRTGFMHFFLCDGDVVELSNLNRQNFAKKDIGQNKVIALKQRLTAINSNISCHEESERIKSLEHFENLLTNSDIIINTIDCGYLYFELIEKYRKQNKLIICPFNPGFGGLIVCFTANSSSAYDFFETLLPLDDVEIARCLLNKPGCTISSQVGKSNKDFFSALSEKGYFPQLAIGAAITSSLTVTAAIEYLKTGTVQVAPYFSYVPTHQKVPTG